MYKRVFIVLFMLLGNSLCAFAGQNSTNIPDVAEARKISTGDYFKYAHENMTGQLRVCPADASSDIPILIMTVAHTNGNTCHFDGTCVVKGTELYCTNEDFNEDKQNYISVKINADDSLSVTHSYHTLCQEGVTLDGTYQKRKEE